MLAGRHSKSVIKAELVGDIPGRLDSIVTDQIDSAEAFMRLLALILGFGVPPEEGEEVSPNRRACREPRGTRQGRVCSS